MVSEPRIGALCYDARDPRRVGRIYDLTAGLVLFRSESGRQYRLPYDRVRLGSPAGVAALRRHQSQRKSKSKHGKESRDWTPAEDAIVLAEYDSAPTQSLAARLRRSVQKVRLRYKSLTTRPEADPKLVATIRENWHRGAAWIANRTGLDILSVMSVASRLEGLQGHTPGRSCLAESEERAGRVRVQGPEMPEAMRWAISEGLEPDDEAAWNAVIWARAAACRGVSA